jgi:hypothetical protein
MERDPLAKKKAEENRKPKDEGPSEPSSRPVKKRHEGPKVCLADYVFHEGVLLSFIEGKKQCKHGVNCRFIHKPEWSKLSNKELYESLSAVRTFENHPEDLEIVRKKLVA